jgi:ribosomal protein S18 acetylase RimI-like enzyme
MTPAASLRTATSTDVALLATAYTASTNGISGALFPGPELRRTIQCETSALYFANWRVAHGPLGPLGAVLGYRHSQPFAGTFSPEIPPHFDEIVNAFSRPTPADEWYIASVYCAPAARRQGVARSLLCDVTRAMLDDACRTVGLHVFERNTAARRLYANLGFFERQRVAWPVSGSLDVPSDLLYLSANEQALTARQSTPG